MRYNTIRKDIKETERIKEVDTLSNRVNELYKSLDNSNSTYDLLNHKVDKLYEFLEVLNFKLDRLYDFFNPSPEDDNIEEHSNPREKLPTLKLSPKQMRSKAMMKVSGEMKCFNCGCDDTRILEIHHKNGDGKNDRDNFYKRILLGLRSVDDLELLCKTCNWAHFIQSKYGIKGYKIVFDPYKP